MKKKFNNNIEVYAVVGYYDDNDTYQEEVFDDCVVRDLHKRISRNIDLAKDVTIQVAPQIEVRAFARSKAIIDELLLIVQNPKYFKEIFDVFSKHNGPYDNGDYVWWSVNLEEERQHQLEKRNLGFYPFNNQNKKPYLGEFNHG